MNISPVFLLSHRAVSAARILVLLLLFVQASLSLRAQVTTFAGSGTAGFVNATGIAAQFNEPRKAVIDGSGNFFIIDTYNHCIRHITPGGVVTTFAGNGTAGLVNATGTAAQFNLPAGIARDAAGNLYIADQDNHAIRMITPGGVVATLAGTGVAGFADGAGTSAQFSSPVDVALNPAQNILYVADANNRRIRAITLPGAVVSTFAGNGVIGATDGLAATAQFGSIGGVAVDANGTLFVSDPGNHRIRKITLEGTVSTLAGSVAGSADGQGTSAQFNSPRQLAIAPNGSLYVSDPFNNKIRMVSPSGMVSTLAGTGGGGSTNGAYLSATFGAPVGVCIDASGDVYIGGNANHNVRKISQSLPTVTSFTPTTAYPMQVVSITGTNFFGVTQVRFGGVNAAWFEVLSQTQIRAVVPTGAISGNVTATNNAGTGTLGGFTLTATPQVSTLAGDGVLGSVDAVGGGARLNKPRHAVKIGGDLYFTEVNGHKVKKMNLATGTVTTVAGSGTLGFANGTGTAASFHAPTGIATDGTNLYVCDENNHAIRRIVIASGVVSTLVGTGTAGFVDNLANGTGVQFSSPQGLACDGTYLYCADYGNNRIRRITIANGATETFAGSGAMSSVDGIGTAATFNLPVGITIDGAYLYSSDGGGHKIRRIHIASKTVTTIAGSGTAGFADGVGAAAQFNALSGLVSDGAGTLYICDAYNHRVRMISLATNTVSTLVGNGTQALVDGALAAGRFNTPIDILWDGTGLIVTDQENHAIRKISPATPTVTSFTPTNAYPMQVVTITGTNFFGVTQVQFGGVNAAWFEVLSQTQIRAVVPFGAGGGNVTATNSAGTGTLGGFAPIVVPAVSTIVGDGTAGSLDAVGGGARANRPRYGVKVGGDMYFTDMQNHQVRKMNMATRTVTTFAGSGTAGFLNGTGTAAQFNLPLGITSDGTNLYVSEANNHTIRKIVIATGVVTTFAGNGAAGFADGTGVGAQFNTPYGMVTDGAGNVYVADALNHRIRVITPGGVVTTLAGSATAGNANGTGAAAQFNRPLGLSLGEPDNLYVSTELGHHVRRIIISTQVVTTLAGSGTAGFADGTGAAAQFNVPVGLAFDGAGTLYVADNLNNRIRAIATSNGATTTITGTAAAGAVDGTLGVGQFFNPEGLMLDGGYLYVFDSGNHRIRMVILPNTTTITGFTPSSASPGDVVTINGAFFTGATQVQFGGVNAASYTVVSASQITATVPAGAASGNVSVTAPLGTASIPGFTFVPVPITSFTPTSAGPGEIVTINGAGFTGATQVQFGGINAPSYTVVSANQITATVPFTAVSGSVSVTAPAGTGTLAGFTFIPLAVTGFMPTAAGPGTVVTINGTGFTGATQVQFGGVNAASFTFVSATQITATVAAGGATGSVSVTSPAGTGSFAGFTFMPNLFYYTGGDAGVRTNWNSVLGGGGVNPLVAQFMANSGDTYIFPTSIPAASSATPLVVGNGVTVTVQNPVTYTPTAALTLNAGAILNINGGATLLVNTTALTNNGTMNVLGSLTFQNTATFTGVSPVYSGAVAALSYSGAGNRTTGTEFPNPLNASLAVDKVGQTVTLNGNRTVLNTFYPFNGTVAMGNFTLTASGNLNFSGAGTLSGGAAAGLVIDGAGTITSDLKISAPASFGTGLTMNRGGTTLTLAGVALSATPLAVLGGTLNTGALNHTFIAPININPGAILNVSPSFTTTFGGNSTNNGSVIIDGTLSLGTTVMSGTGGFTVNPTGTLVTAHPTGLAGALVNTGGHIHNGTVHIQGASVGNSVSMTLNNLIINRATAVTMPQNLTVSGVLTIANTGNFDLAGRQLTLGASASTATSATGTIDASGVGSVILVNGTTLNGAHFTGGAVRQLDITSIPTISNSLAVTNLLNMLNDLTLGAPNGRLWLRTAATLNAPGTRIQGTNPTSEVIIDAGANAGTIPGGAFAMPYNGAITFLGASNLTGTLTMSAAAGAFTMGGNITLQAASTLMLNQIAANALVGTGVLQGSGATSGIVLGSGFNANVLPADRFAATLNANLTTPGGAAVLTGGALTLGATQTLTLGGRLTTTLTDILRVTNTATTSIAGASTTNFIDGPLERSLLGGIVVNGTSYLLPIGDGTSYRPMTLRDVRTGGTAPVMRGRVVGTGATIPDNLTILSLLSGRNWQLETVLGVFTSTTLDVTEGGLSPTDLIGMSATQAGAYASIGGFPNAGFVRSTAQAALGNRFYAIAGTPPSIFYYNETLLGDASLASSWNSVPNGSGVPATPALMTSGTGVAFIVRSGITATATGSMSFGAGVSFTLQPSSRLTVQTGTLSIAGTAGISGILNIGTVGFPSAALMNSGAVNIAGDGTLRLTGNATVSGTAPTFAAATSALEYDGTVATTAGVEWAATAAHTIRIANTGGVRLSANRTLANTANLTVQTNGVLHLSDGIALTNNGNVLVAAQATVSLDGNAQINGASGITYLSTSTLEFTDAVATPNTNAGGKAFPATMYGNVIAKNSFTLPESKTVHGAWTGAVLPATATVNVGSETLTLLGAIDIGGTAFQSTAAGGFVVEGAGEVRGTVMFPSGNLGTLAIKRAGVKLRLGSLLTLASSLRLEGGIIVSTGAGITLVPASNGALVGGSETSYVEGALARTLAANLNNNAASWLFPVGKGDVYLPLALSQLTTGVVAPLFRATVFRDVPPGNMILAPGETGTLNNGEVWLTRVESGNYIAAAFTITRSNASTNLPSGTQVASAPGISYTSRGGTVSGKSVRSLITNALGYFALKFPSSLVITDFSPKSGTTGTVVTIRGLNLNRADLMFFGSAPSLGTSSFSRISSSELRVTVGSDFASGKIQLWTDVLHGLLGVGERVYSDSLFNFIAPPSVTLFSPSQGVVGDVVTVYGTNLGDVTNVYFNGVPATSFRLISSGELEAVVPANGFGRITFVNAAGSVITSSSFGNLTPPAITNFTPSAGISGSFITISGTNFLGATAVKFGTINAATFSIISNTQITAVVGPGGATGKISITGPGGTGQSAQNFTFGLMPTVSSILPSPSAPGTIVTATGTYLDGIQAVSVGGLAADSLGQISSTQVRFRIPNLVFPLGRDSMSFPVQIKVSSGTANSTLLAVRPPNLGTFLPDSGRVGDTVRLSGTGLTNITSVQFAGISAFFRALSATELLMVVPSGIPYNRVLVTATIRGVNTSGIWNHIPPRPTLTAQNLDSGEVGTTLRLTGTNFFADSKVFFKGVEAASIEATSIEAASVQVLSTTSVVAVVPRGAVTGVITLSTQFGVAAMPRPFTVLLPQPRITAITPTSAGAGGLVRISGIRFDSTAVISFGGVPAQTFVSSSTNIVAVVPTGVRLGEVVVSVRTVNGTTQAITPFTVLPSPELTLIDPISEGAGEPVRITGRNFTDVTTLTVSGTAVQNFTIVSDSVIVFTVDGISPGRGTVTAFSPGGQGSYATLFEVLPASVANAPRNLTFEPNVGPAGTRIRVTGRNLGGIVTARIGGVAAASVEQISTTEVIVVLGRGATGAIVLTNSIGTGGSRTAFRFQTALELDSLALVSFYNTHKPSGNALPGANWLTANRLQTWQGVSVGRFDDDDRVIGVTLANMSLRSTPLQMQDLVRLSALRTLNLSNNGLSGSLPVQIAQLANLTELHLANNRFSAAIPAELSQLPLLEILDLRQNQLSGSIPTTLVSLPHLRVILLSNNEFTGSLPTPANTLVGKTRTAKTNAASVLEVLEASNNELSGEIPNTINAYTHLRVLDVANNDLNGAIPRSIGDCLMLENLTLNNNRLGGTVPADITRCGRLERLNLSNNVFTHVPDLSVLRRRLKAVFVEHNRLDFGSLESNITMDTLRYAPQDTLDVAQRSATGVVGLPLRMPLSVGGANNRFAWERGGRSIGALPTAFSLPDTGVYVCRITNDRVPHLTLITRPIIVNGRLPLPPNAAPQAVFPPNSAINTPTDVRTEWTGVAEAAMYDIELTTTQDFTGVVTRLRETELQTVAEGLTNLQRYYWRVRAVNAGGAGPWSAVSTFVTVRPGAVLAAVAEAFPKTAIDDVSFRRVILTNLISQPIRIDSITFAKGENETENSFETRSVLRALTIEGKQERTVSLAFAPKSIGQKRGTMTAYFTILNTQTQEIERFEQVLSGRGSALKAIQVEFDTVLAGKSTISSALLINRGRTPIQVGAVKFTNSTNGLVSGAFSFQGADGRSFTVPPIAKGRDITLAGGDTLNITVRCDARAVGNQAADLVWETINTGADTAEVIASAFVRPPEPADVAVRFGIRAVDENSQRRDSVAPGGTTWLEIYIAEGNLDSLLRVAQPEMRAVVRFEKNVLALSTNERSVRALRGANAAERMLRVQVPTTRWDGRSPVIARFECRAVAGDILTSPLELESVQWGGIGGSKEPWERKVYIVAPQNGVFTAKACEAGGTRLVISAKPTHLAIVAPNPAKEQVSVSYTLREDGFTEIALIDANGKMAQILVAEEQTAGEYSITRGLKGLPSGSYTVRLTTQNGIISRQVNVVR